MKKVIIDGIEYVPVTSVKNTKKQVVKRDVHFELYPEDSPMMTWNETKEYCKLLGEGWRLPTISEMFYIYNDNLITEGSYWSSTEYDNFNAWYFYFYYGNANFNYKSTTFYVRAVRDINN